MKQILLMIAMAPSPDQIDGIILTLLAFLVVAVVVAVCLLVGLKFLIRLLVFLIKRLGLLVFGFIMKVHGDDPVPPEEKASE